jgi:hypothetical protein
MLYEVHHDPCLVHLVSPPGNALLTIAYLPVVCSRALVVVGTLPALDEFSRAGLVLFCVGDVDPALSIVRCTTRMVITQRACLVKFDMDHACVYGSFTPTPTRRIRMRSRFQQ